MFECVVIFIIPPSSKVYVFVFSTTDFRPAYHFTLYLWPTVQTQMKCNTMLISSGSALIAKLTDETEIY